MSPTHPSPITWLKLLLSIFALTLSLYWSYPHTSHTACSSNHPLMTPKSAFKASRLTPSTFLIKEYNDIFSEHPHIYIKLIPSANTTLIIDTGTGGKSNDPTVRISSLRKFIETIKVEENNNQPLNEGGKMKYLVILTHCHYDHILGIEDFSNDSVILASAHSKAFLSKENLPEHSLCNALHIKVPQYTPKLVPHGFSVTSPTHPYTSLNIIILHTPGHTPDEVAIYDANEMMLYVGDTLYENAPIIFPKEGSLVTWLESVDYLMAFVTEKNAIFESEGGSASKQVMINAGHETAMRPAKEVLADSKAFLEDVIRGRESVKGRQKGRGEDRLIYEQEGGRFSLWCPERLIEEARRKSRLMPNS